MNVPSDLAADLADSLITEVLQLACAAADYPAVTPVRISTRDLHEDTCVDELDARLAELIDYASDLSVLRLRLILGGDGGRINPDLVLTLLPILGGLESAADRSAMYLGPEIETRRASGPDRAGDR